MSDETSYLPRPKVKLEHIGDPEGALAKRLAKLRNSNASISLTAAARAVAAPQKTATSWRAVEIVASMQKATPDVGRVLGAHQRVRDIVEVPQIDWTNMPEARRTRAAEDTVEALKVRVDAACVAQAQAAEAEKRAATADRRETVMLRWTVAGVLLAAIVAVGSIITAFLG